MRRLVVVLFMALTALIGGAGTATAAPTTPDVSTAATAAAASCAEGYVCIYKGDTYDGNNYHPLVARYYKYGNYNLSNFVGVYTISNCQTGGANVAGYSGYNATGSQTWRSQGRSCPGGFVMNLTSTNSIRLYA